MNNLLLPKLDCHNTTSWWFIRRDELRRRQLVNEAEQRAIDAEQAAIDEQRAMDERQRVIDEPRRLLHEKQELALFWGIHIPIPPLPPLPELHPTTTLTHFAPIDPDDEGLNYSRERMELMIKTSDGTGWI